MNFLGPRLWLGKDIRTSHLGNFTTAGICNQHLQYQVTSRKSVRRGARRKASWVARNRHIARAFLTRLTGPTPPLFMMSPARPQTSPVGNCVEEPLSYGLCRHAEHFRHASTAPFQLRRGPS